MADTEISVAVVRVLAELTDFRKEMKTMGPAAEAAAGDMVRAIKAQLKQAEAAHKHTSEVAAAESKKAAAAASAAAKVAGKSWNDVAKSMQSNQMISDLEQVGAMFIMVGGSVSKMAMLFTSAVRPVAMIGTMLGPQGLIALGLAAIPLAAVGVFSAMRGIVDGAVEAEASLRKLGVVTKQSANVDLQAYELAATELTVAVDALKVALGSDLAPAVTLLIQATTEAIRTFGELREALDPVVQIFRTVLRASMFVVSAGLSEVALQLLKDTAAAGQADTAFAGLAARLGDVARKTYEKIAADESARAIAEENQDLLDARHVAEVQAAADAAAAAAATRAHTEKVKEYIAAVMVQKDAELDYGRVQNELSNQWVQNLDKVVSAMSTITDGTKNLEQETTEIIDNINAKMAEDAQKKADLIKQMWLNFTTGMISALGDIMSSWQAMSQRRIADIEAEMSADEERIDEIRARYEEFSTDRSKGSRREREEIRQRSLEAVNGVKREIAAKEQAAQKAREEAQTAYALSQSFASAQVMIQSAVAIAGMTAALAPLTGPQAPIIAASLGLALMTTQLAAIAAAPAPEFPMGGMTSPDHRLIGVRGDEGVLNPRGLRGIGGSDGLDALNAGVGQLNGSSSAASSLLREIRDLLRPPRGPSVITAMRGRR